MNVDLKEFWGEFRDSELEDRRAGLFESQNRFQHSGHVVGIFKVSVIFRLSDQVNGPVDDVQRTLGFILQLGHGFQHSYFMLQDQSGPLDRVQRRILPSYWMTHGAHE